MLVALAFCLKDKDQVERLANWMIELGCEGHKLILAVDRRVGDHYSKKIVDLFHQTFDEVDQFFVTDDVWDKWPESPNNVFRKIAKMIEYSPVPEAWLWIEPDVIPLVPDWIGKIEAEYKLCGKPFMGDKVDVNGIPVHMSGVGVYPGDISTHAGLTCMASDVAWDVFGADQIVPKMAQTRLISHHWKHPSVNNESEFENLMAQLPKECVLFHADKAGSMIPFLRKMLLPPQKASMSGVVELPMAYPAKFKFEDGKYVPLTSIQAIKSADESFNMRSALELSTLPEDCSRESLVRDAVGVLKQLCSAPRYISHVRRELKAQGVTR